MKLYSSDALKGYQCIDRNKFLNWLRRSLQSKVFFSHIKSRESRILDIGCGGSKFLNILHENGFSNICGVEPDPLLVEISLKKYPYLLNKVKCAGATNLPYDDLCFDCVYYFNVMHHLEGLEEYKAAITEAHRVLKNNGILILIEPCRKWIYTVKRNLAYLIAPFSTLWAIMYKMMNDEKEIMERFLDESDNIYFFIRSNEFEVLKYEKHFHQSVLIIKKRKHR